ERFPVSDVAPLGSVFPAGFGRLARAGGATQPADLRCGRAATLPTIYERGGSGGAALAYPVLGDIAGIRRGHAARRLADRRNADDRRFAMNHRRKRAGGAARTGSASIALPF